MIVSDVGEPLARVIGQQRCAGFRGFPWPDTHFIERGPPERFAVAPFALTSEIRALVERHTGPRRAVFVDAGGGEQIRPVSDGAFARALYDGGTSMMLVGVVDTDLFAPTWSAQFLRALALEPEDCGLTVTGFASPPGAGVSLHYDSVAIFVWQIRGRKRWRIAPNDAIRDPEIGWGPRRANRPPRALRARSRRSIALPPDATTFVLEPGDCLYLPRAYWHETTALEESFGLTVIPRPRSQRHVVLARLAAQIDGDADWNALSHGLNHVAPSTRATQHVAMLMHAMRDRLKRPAG